MKKIALLSGCLAISPLASAGISLGDKASAQGEFSINGSIRLNYQDKDFQQPSKDNKVQFTLGQVLFGYDSPKYFGGADIRCYQYDTLCDLSVLTYAYAGYKFNDTDNLTLGLQPVPFGPARFWENTFYGSLNNTMGLQDIHNLGLKYHVEPQAGTKLDLAYFINDGGNYHGLTKDSARYTANFVEHDQLNQDILNEKHMWVAKLAHEFAGDDLKLTTGGSYWYSQIENKTRKTEGNRQAWNIFGQVNYLNIGLNLTIGQLDVDSNSARSTGQNVVGSFDAEYMLANKGDYYTAELNHTFKVMDDKFTIMPFLMFSGYLKDQKQFEDSERHIAGAMFGYEQMYLYAEYLWARNDPFMGGSGESLGRGDDNKWNKMFNLTLIYTF